MDAGLLVGLLLGPVVTAAMAGIARAAATGHLQRNRMVGIRVPSTLAYDDAWRAGHRAAVAPACWSAVVLVGADLVAILLHGAGIPSGALTVGLIAMVLLSIAWVALAANRSARADGPPRM